MRSMNENLSPHLEGGPDCKLYKVQVTEELFDEWGMSVDWGQPDEEGFYTPALRREATVQYIMNDYVGMKARIAELVDVLEQAELWITRESGDNDGILTLIEKTLAPGTGEAG